MAQQKRANARPLFILGFENRDQQEFCETLNFGRIKGSAPQQLRTQASPRRLEHPYFPVFRYPNNVALLHRYFRRWRRQSAGFLLPRYQSFDQQW